MKTLAHPPFCSQTDPFNFSGLIEVSLVHNLTVKSAKPEQYYENVNVKSEDDSFKNVASLV